MNPMPDLCPPAAVPQPIPNATNQELQGAPNDINTLAVRAFMPQRISPVPPDFDPTEALLTLGPLTPSSLATVMTLQATYERIRHLESVVRSREERVAHWEAECRAAVEWKNESASNGPTTTKMQIVQTGSPEGGTKFPATLKVYGESYDTRWSQEPPLRGEAEYILVQDLTCGTPILTWPVRLFTAANDVLRKLGADPVPMGDGHFDASAFYGRASNAILAQEEMISECREAVGLTDTDDITLLERLREMVKAQASPSPKAKHPTPKKERRAR